MQNLMTFMQVVQVNESNLLSVAFLPNLLEASPPRPCPWLQGWPRRILGYGCVFAIMYGICTEEQSDLFKAFTQS